MTSDAHATRAAATPAEPQVARRRRRTGARPVRAAVALLLAAGAAVLWFRSRNHTDYVVFFTPGSKVQGAASDRRGLFVAFSNLPLNPEYGLSAGGGSVPSDRFEEMRGHVYDAVERKHDRWGFGLVVSDVHLAVRFPHWLLLAPAGSVALNELRRWRRQRVRRRRGQCLRCGYDLRSNPSGRCPECGEERE